MSRREPELEGVYYPNNGPDFDDIELSDAEEDREPNRHTFARVMLVAAALAPSAAEFVSPPTSEVASHTISATQDKRSLPESKQAEPTPSRPSKTKTVKVGSKRFVSSPKQSTLQLMAQRRAADTQGSDAGAIEDAVPSNGQLIVGGGAGSVDSQHKAEPQAETAPKAPKATASTALPKAQRPVVLGSSGILRPSTSSVTSAAKKVIPSVSVVVADQPPVAAPASAGGENAKVETTNPVPPKQTVLGSSGMLRGAPKQSASPPTSVSTGSAPDIAINKVKLLDSKTALPMAILDATQTEFQAQVIDFGQSAADGFALGTQAPIIASQSEKLTATSSATTAQTVGGNSAKTGASTSTVSPTPAAKASETSSASADIQKKIQTISADALQAVKNSDWYKAQIKGMDPTDCGVFDSWLERSVVNPLFHTGGTYWLEQDFRQDTAEWQAVNTSDPNFHFQEGDFAIAQGGPANGHAYYVGPGVKVINASLGGHGPAKGGTPFVHESGRFNGKPYQRTYSVFRLVAVQTSSAAQVAGADAQGTVPAKESTSGTSDGGNIVTATEASSTVGIVGGQDSGGLIEGGTGASITGATSGSSGSSTGATGQSSPSPQPAAKPSTGEAKTTTAPPTTTPPSANTATAPSGEVPQITADNAANVRMVTSVQFFMTKGLTLNQAAGLVGNFWFEGSGDNPNAVQGKGGAGRGIGQWSVDGRWQVLLKFAKDTGNRSPNDLQVQNEFVWQELNTTYKKALTTLQTTKTSAEAATVVEQLYEAAGIPHLPERIVFAQTIEKAMTGFVVTSAPAAGKPANSQPPASADTTNQGQNNKADNNDTRTTPGNNSTKASSGDTSSTSTTDTTPSRNTNGSGKRNTSDAPNGQVTQPGPTALIDGGGENTAGVQQAVLTADQTNVSSGQNKDKDQSSNGKSEGVATDQSNGKSANNEKDNNSGTQSDPAQTPRVNLGSVLRIARQEPRGR